MSDPPPTSRHITVRRGVIGIIPDRTKYLLIQRAQHLARGGCWCFPGGQLERGENSRRAVIREIREELGISVEPLRRLGAVRVLESNYILAVWLVRMNDGDLIQPAASEIADFRWLTLDQIRLMKPDLPSNRTVIEMLERFA